MEEIFMYSNKNRFMKSSISIVLIIMMLLGLVSVHIIASSEEQLSVSVLPENESRLPTNTPRPEISLYSAIPAEKAETSAQLYHDVLGYDPQLFLLSDEGIKHLWFFWDDVGTDEELADLENIAAQITKDCSSVEEKIFAVAEYLALNIGYDYDYLDSNDITKLAVNPWDVLQKRTTVCEGYARTADALLQTLDIPCICVYSPNHAWNMAYTGERWLLFDSTWMTYNEYRNGVLTLYDEIMLDWYDFTIDQANGNESHLIESTDLCVVDGVLTRFPSYTEQTDVVIPYTVEEIGDDVYVTREDCNIETVYLPASVKTIGEVAFYFGNTLETIFYQGTPVQFSQISIKQWNDNFLDCDDIWYLDEITPPYITKHPTDSDIGKGDSVTLSAVVACDTGKLTYQWYQASGRTNESGAPIAGAVSSSLTVTGNTIGETYYYLEATLSHSSLGNNDTKSVKTAPCKVRVFEEAPSEIIRIGPFAMMYIYSGSNTVHMEGSGKVKMNWWNIPYGSTVYIDKDITSIANPTAALYNTEKIVVENGSTHYLSDTAGALYDLSTDTLLVLPNYSSVTEYTVLEGTRIIAEEAIYPSLTSISLPESLEEIQGSLVFPIYLREIKLAENNEHFYLDEYGALIDIAGKRIVQYPGDKAIISQYVVPDGIKYIEDRAFMYADIRSIVFNDDVVSIGAQAFFNSNYFTEIEFPMSLNSIGTSAFKANYNLTDVYFKGNAPESWGDSVFAPYSGRNPITIHYPDSASGWTTPTWKPEGESVTYNTVPYESNNVEVNAAHVEYTVNGQIVTIKTTSAVCKVGYLVNGSYVSVEAVTNADTSHSFTVPDGVEEVLAVITGDINLDGKLDTADTELLAHALLPSSHSAHEELTAKQVFSADINGNGKLNSADKALFARSMLSSTHKLYKPLEW